MKSNGYPLDLRNRGFLNEISNSAIKDSSQKEDSVNDQPNQATTAFRCTLEKLVHCCQHLTADRNLKTQGQTQSTTDYDYVPQNQTLAPSRPQSLNSCFGNQSLEDIIFAVLFHIMTSWSQKSVTQPRALFRVPSTLEQVIIVAVEAEFVHDCFDLIEAACHIQTTVVDTLSNRSDHKWVCLPIHAALRAVGTLLRPTVQQAGCSWELCFLIDKMSSTEATLMPQHVLGYHGIRHRAELWHLQRELKFFRHRENTLLQREAKLRAFCGVYDITLEQLDTLPNISPEKVEETSLFFRDYYTLTTTPPRSTSPCQRSEEDLQTCCVDEVENSAVDEARHHAIIPPVKSKNKTVLADTSNAGGGENAQWIQTHLHELETLQLKNLEDALRFQNTVRGGSGPWAGAEPEPGTNQTLRSSNRTMQTSKSSLKIFGVQKPVPALLSNVQSFGPVCTYTDNSAHITKLNSVSTGLDHPTQAESKVVNGSTTRRVLELSSIEGCSSDSESITSMSISTTASVQPSVRNGVKL